MPLRQPFLPNAWRRHQWTVAQQAAVPAEHPEGRLVFVVGCPRSGTTYLWRLLHAHPGVEAIRPKDFGAAQNIKADPERVCSEIETGAFLRYDQDTIQRVVEAKRAECPDKLLIEKTPTHCLLLDPLFHTFPKARVLWIWRDPIATLVSYVKNLLGLMYLNGSTDGEVWRAGAQLIARCQREWKRHSQDRRVQRVDYEILCDEPARELRSILNFAGLEVAEAAGMVAAHPPHNANEETLASLNRKEERLKNEHAEGLVA